MPRFSPVLCTLLLSLCSVALWAQEIRPQGPPPPRLIWGLEQQVRYFAETEVDDDFSGDVASLTGTTTVSLTKFSTRTRASLSLSYGLHHYDWTGPTPLEEAQTLRIGVTGSHRFQGTDWGLFGVAGLSFSGEFEDNAWWDGRSFLVGFGPTYWMSQDLRISLGLMAVDSPERDVRFFPILRVVWQIDDRWALETGRGITVAYQLDDAGAWTASAGLEIEAHALRTRDQRLPGDARQTGPVLEDTAVILQAGLEYRPQDAFFVRGGLGAAVWRKFRLRENETDRLEGEADPTLALTLAAGVRF